MVEIPEQAIQVLGQAITPETVREVIQKARAVRWGTHLLRWRYFDVTHEGVTYHHNALIPTALWHLLKRIYVDQEWPPDTTLEQLHDGARATIEHPATEIYVYGYYRTDPPRRQWGFFHPTTAVAVVYDVEADLVATVFKPAGGARFFQRQIAVIKINREGWHV
jgi:hypothetical protein